MEKQPLQDMLETLRTELGDSEQMDSGTRDLLARLHEDIEVLLDLSSEASPADHVQVRTGLMASVERFEGTHPSLTAAMNRVLNLLVSIGI